uniref:Uncharacterized protein n=1 Tax=Globisporangium ultimum (strain ATCC 200006 / CBS 805.95 / DAOM BR144) TaxID=431595 RepID=K3W626_GLOUD
MEATTPTEFVQLLFSGPPQHQAVLLVLGALVLLSVALRYKQLREDAAAVPAEDKSIRKKRHLRRKMSSIGMTTLISEIDTNLSIPVSVLKINGKVTKQELGDRVQKRMNKDPFFIRFRSLVVDGDHEFVEVPDYDASRNIFTHVLTDGESVLSYVESLVNSPLDFSKPLWEMHVIVDPAEEHQDEDDAATTTIAWKVHHCIGDGASLSTAMIRLSDNKDQFEAMIQKMLEENNNKKKTPRPAKTPKQVVRDFGLLLAFCVWSAIVIFKKFCILLFRTEPVTMFKQPGGTSKRLSYTVQYSVATTKQIGKKYSATVNDIMLNCVAGAMRKTMLAAGEKVSPNLVVRAAIPVDMRSTNEVILSAHNKFSALVLDFPVGVEDPEKRLKLIRCGMEEAKNSLEKHFTYFTSHVVALLPASLMKAIVRFTGTRISVAISNVRGSSSELGMCGNPIVGFYGFVPPPPTVNLGIAILSVGDDLGLNVLVDPSVAIDSKQFLEFAREEYEALKQRVSEPPANQREAEQLKKEN